MEASSGLYRDSFERARPNSAFQAVQGRVHLMRALTQDVAAYYHERALAEEAYTKALNKLASRLRDAGSATVLANIPHQVNGASDRRQDERTQLGAWHAVIARLETELKDTTRMHEQWRKRAVEEVEAPLAGSTTDATWTRWTQAEAHLASTVKEYEAQLDKVQKVRPCVTWPAASWRRD